MKSKAKSHAKRKAVETFRGATVLGVTKDGVKILKGKGRAPHFTAKEIRTAVANVRATRTDP